MIILAIITGVTIIFFIGIGIGAAMSKIGSTNYKENEDDQ